jgi:hypothetical protein
VKKKQGIEHPSYGILAVQEKVTREYLMRSSTHTVDDEALTVELWSARRAYALQQAEQVRTMVLPTPQLVELLLRTKYPGEGEPLPHEDPHTHDGVISPPARLFGTTNGRVGQRMSS